MEKEIFILKTKQIINIIFFIFFSIRADAQIIKIFSPNAESNYYFGSYVGIDNGKIAILEEQNKWNSEYNIIHLYEKKASKLDYMFGEKTKLYMDVGFNLGGGGSSIRLEQGIVIEHFPYSTNASFPDTLFFKKPLKDKLETQSSYLFHSYDGFSNFCIKNDWLMYRIKGVIHGKSYQKDCFIKKINDKWVIQDSFKYWSTEDDFYIVGSSNEFQMTNRFVIAADGFYGKKGMGKVFIYEKIGEHWRLFQEIFHPESSGDKGDFFGYNTEISEDNQFLFIGAHYSTDKIPKVYVYKLAEDSFKLYQILTEPDFTGHEFYGTGISIENGVLLFGRYSFKKRGMIYQYYYNGNKWMKKAEIQPELGLERDAFGVSIDQEGETVVVGAYLDSTFHFYPNGAAYIFQIPARDTLRAEICQGQSYTFNDTVIYDEGHYTDTLLASYGVDSVVQLYLTVHPEARVEIDTVLCEKGDMLQVGDSILTEAGVYEIRLKDMFGCDSIVTVHLDYESLEVADSITADYGCENGKIDLILQNANNPPYAFSWSGGERTEDISGLSSGVYTVKIMDKSGCEYQYEYTVDDSIAYLIPNAFFPSGQEELNKTFRIYQAKDVDVLSTEIYDRWGEKIFNVGQNEYWDGTYQGKMQSPGVYLYRIVIDSPCGEEVKTGQVMLLR